MVALNVSQQQINQIRRFPSIPQTPDSLITQRPAPYLLNDLLEQFIEFANNDDDSLDPIVQTAVLHAQFELIHPFDDGNGRIGRILIPLALMRRRSIISPSLYISGYLEVASGHILQAAGEHLGEWRKLPTVM